MNEARMNEARSTEARMNEARMNEARMNEASSKPPFARTSTPPPHADCLAFVVIPARNEERGLPATLDALRHQVDLHGQPLAHATFEVLLLLNNCTDGSAAVAAAYAGRHPGFQLILLEESFPPEQAHVGTARRMLLDLACARCEQTGGLALLSTDADTIVAPDWLARNLQALAAGAEVVGGVIHLFEKDYAALEPGVRAAYDHDREYQSLVARLESLLDPDEADPWPRHLEHFGASLACTPAVYRRSGGLPAVKPLEDVAFIQALRRVGARIRHAPTCISPPLPGSTAVRRSASPASCGTGSAT